MKRNTELRDRQKQIVLNAIIDAAEKGKKCPRNIDLSYLIGGQNADLGQYVFGLLLKDKVINVEYTVNTNHRCVTIISTGQKTAAYINHKTVKAAEPKKPTKADEVQQKLYDYLRKVAEAGKHCPTFIEIAAAFGCSDYIIRESLIALQSQGKLTKRTTRSIGHIITFPDGKRTAGNLNDFIQTEIQPVIYKQVFGRDPCAKCGVRGDIGCRHQPKAQYIERAST